MHGWENKYTWTEGNWEYRTECSLEHKMECRTGRRTDCRLGRKPAAVFALHPPISSIQDYPSRVLSVFETFFYLLAINIEGMRLVHNMPTVIISYNHSETDKIKGPALHRA
jgi:hypothetical protein